MEEDRRFYLEHTEFGATMEYLNGDVTKVLEMSLSEEEDYLG